MTPFDLVLLGAGASAEAEVPTSFAMTRKCVEAVQKANGGTNKAQHALSVAVAGLVLRNGMKKRSAFEDINVEDLYSCLTMLAGRHELAIAPFVGSWSPALLTADETIPDDKLRNLAELLVALKTDDRDSPSVARQIYEIAREPNGPDGSGFRAAQQALLEEIRTFTEIRENDPRDLSYLYPLVREASGRDLWIFSLNYDTSIETACHRLELTHSYGLADDGVSFGATTDVKIAKLHGSINWAYGSKGIETQWGRHRNPVMIFGSGNKLRVKGPFLDLLFLFREKLSMAKSILVAGYGFGDEHINYFLRRWHRRGIPPSGPVMTVVNGNHFSYDDLASRLYDERIGSWLSHSVDIRPETLGSFLRGGGLEASPTLAPLPKAR